MKIRVAAVQFKIVAGAVERNLTSALRFAREAVSRGANFVVFPESMTSDYVKKIPEFTESIPGPTTNAFGKLAKETGANFVVSLNEKEGSKIYNSVALIEPNRIAGVYRKTHLWRDEDNLEGFDDEDVFTAGSKIDVFDFGGIKAGVMICWDGQYPEVSRLLSLKGAEVIFYPNNRSGMNHAYIGALAERNVVGIVAVNRVGIREIFPPDLKRTRKMLPVPVEEEDGKIIYRCWGDTAIFDEMGKLLVSVRDVEKVIITELDITRIRKRKAAAQYLRYRRPDLYTKITEKTE